MMISDFKVGQGPVFVVAEIGNNHNGSLAKAIELIDMTALAKQITSNSRSGTCLTFIGKAL